MKNSSIIFFLEIKISGKDFLANHIEMQLMLFLQKTHTYTNNFPEFKSVLHLGFQKKVFYICASYNILITHLPLIKFPMQQIELHFTNLAVALDLE